MSSLIEQAAKRLEELRRAGVDVDDAPLVTEAPTIKRAPTPEAMVRALETRTAHYQVLRDRLIDGVLNTIPNAHLTGHPEQRLPSHASFVFDNIYTGSLVELLDGKGIAGSAACLERSRDDTPSLNMRT